MPPLPYARVFLNDLFGECITHGLSLRAQGILFRLLWTQHMTGAIPAELGDIRRLLGEDVPPAEVKAVVDLFFPRTKDRSRRTNPQHAAARETALRAYEAQV